jgi:hypothetical protein
MKRKIISANASRLYGIDPARVRDDAASSDLGWTDQVLAAYGVR